MDWGTWYRCIAYWCIASSTAYKYIQGLDLYVYIITEHADTCKNYTYVYILSQIHAGPKPNYPGNYDHILLDALLVHHFGTLIFSHVTTNVTQRYNTDNKYTILASLVASQQILLYIQFWLV